MAITTAAVVALALVCLAAVMVLLEVTLGPTERPHRLTLWRRPEPGTSHPSWDELDRAQLRQAALDAHRELEQARHEIYPVGLA